MSFVSPSILAWTAVVDVSPWRSRRGEPGYVINL